MSMFGGSDTVGNYLVKVGADISDLESQMKKAAAVANGVVNDIQTKIGGIKDTLASVGQSAAGAFGALAGVAGVAVGALTVLSTAVDAEDRANRRLGRSLSGLTGDVQGAVSSFAAFAEELEGITARSSTSITKLAAQMATLGGISGPQLEQASAAAIGLAASYEHVGVTAEEAGRMIARAAGGDFAALERIGMTFDESADGAARYNQVVREGLEGLRQSNEDSKTWVGGLRHLQNAAMDLAATIGRTLGLGESGGQILRSIAGTVDVFAGHIAAAKPVVDDLIDTLKALFSVGAGEGFFDSLISGLSKAFQLIALQVEWLARKIEFGIKGMLNSVIEMMPKEQQEQVRGGWEEGKTFAAGAYDAVTTELADTLMGSGSMHPFARSVRSLWSDNPFPNSRSDREALWKNFDIREEHRWKVGTEAARLERERAARGKPWFDLSGFDQISREIDVRMAKVLHGPKGYEDSPDFIGPPAPERASLVDDLIERLNAVTTGGLGFAKDDDEGRGFSAQSIQTVLGELAIPGTADRVRAVQEAQLTEQRQIRQGIQKIAGGGMKVLLIK